MIKEYEGHRIPDYVEIDPDVEHLTFCAECKKDLIIPMDYPMGNYYCRSCGEKNIRKRDIEVKEPAPEHDNIILSKRPPIAKSSKRFSKATLFMMLSLAIIMVRIAIELGSRPNDVFKYETELWIVFAISTIISLFYFAWAWWARHIEKRQEYPQ